VPILNALLSVANDRRGWPMMPIVYVRFHSQVPEQMIGTVIPPGDPRVLLVDIDPASPEHGTSYPLVAASLPPDPYVPTDLVAFAPRPGIVLRGDTKYALIVRSAFARSRSRRPSSPVAACPRPAAVRCTTSTARS
jgi:hypothetical protein